MHRTSVALFLSTLTLAAGTTACSPSPTPDSKDGDTPKQELGAPANPSAPAPKEEGEGGEGGEG